MSTDQEYPGWKRKINDDGRPYFTRIFADEAYVYVVGTHRPTRDGFTIWDTREACHNRAVGDVLREVEQYALGLAHTRMLESIDAWGQVKKELGL